MFEPLDATCLKKLLLIIGVTYSHMLLIYPLPPFPVNTVFTDRVETPSVNTVFTYTVFTDRVEKKTFSQGTCHFTAKLKELHLC